MQSRSGNVDPITNFKIAPSSSPDLSMPSKKEPDERVIPLGNEPSLPEWLLVRLQNESHRLLHPLMCIICNRPKCRVESVSLPSILQQEIDHARQAGNSGLRQSCWRRQTSTQMLLFGNRLQLRCKLLKHVSAYVSKNAVPVAWPPRVPIPHLPLAIAEIVPTRERLALRDRRRHLR